VSHMQLAIGTNIVPHVNALRTQLQQQLQLPPPQLPLLLPQPPLQLKPQQADVDLLNGPLMFGVMMKTTTLTAIGMVVHVVSHMELAAGTNIVPHVNVLTPMQVELHPQTQQQQPLIQLQLKDRLLDHPLEVVLTCHHLCKMLIELLEGKQPHPLFHGK